MRTSIGVGMGVALLTGVFLLAAATAAVPAQTENVTVRDVTYAGGGAIATTHDGLFLWQEASHEFDVVVGANGTRASVEVCLVAEADGTSRDLTCEAATVAANSVESVRLALSVWPTNLTGERRVWVEVRGRTVVPGTERTVTVLRKPGDWDVDGLPNRREAALGTDLTRTDTDADGLGDRFEVETYGTDPVGADSDSDGLWDGNEVRRYQTDPRETDTDGDGLDDGDEIRVHGTNPNRADTDGDRLADGEEVNTYQTDPLAVDADDDGLGDGTEVLDRNTNPNDRDTDGDRLSDGREWTVFGTAPTRGDTDGDGLSDHLEVTAHRTDPSVKDSDGDGREDGAEVTSYSTNPNARDTDSDGMADGVELRLGTNPTVPTADQRTGLLQSLTLLGPVEGLFVGSVVLTVAVGLYWLDPDLARVTGVVGELKDTVTGGSNEQALADMGPTTVTKPPEVLTNEERVQRLLVENDGRMLQSEMVEEVDWSKATVSRVLSRMEEDGAVTRVDIGKGNLVTRPQDEPVVSGVGTPEE